MDSTTGIAIGQVVKSKAGRDKDRIFLVLHIIDHENVFIVDGDLRKLENPKKKKIKHLIVYKKVIEELQDIEENKLNNSYIRKLLKPLVSVLIKCEQEVRKPDA
ncbi:MAG: hypothetical protein GX947_10010 [Tissierellia bacterium]|nr:hypothetical protein [Tissierellia bacterium]NMA50076.1 hypothetical protein [Tissierellia bacterium]